MPELERKFIGHLSDLNSGICEHKVVMVQYYQGANAKCVQHKPKFIVMTLDEGEYLGFVDPEQ